MARVVVVGGGLGGTASAARLAKLGHEVTLVERADRLGGAVGFLERDGYRWDTGPTATALPAVLRDLFRKSGRPLERELDLVPVEPMREHRFEDGSAVALPSGSRAAQQQAIDAGLGPGLGDRWLDWTHGFADTWNLLRRDYLERPYSPDHVGKETRATLTTRTTLHRAVTRAFKDERLRALALAGTVLDGHDPRNVPAWVGMTAYVEQNFGVWTVPGGMGALAGAMTKRLGERRVDVRLGTTVEDLVVRDGRATGVVTDGGLVEADLVVCAVDPRRLPALASLVRRTMPALPPVVCHLGLQGDVPALPHEVVLHGDPLLVVRTGGSAPDGGAAWTVLGRGRLAEDIVTALARRGVDVREQVRVRVDLSPRDLVETYGGSPYGVLWQGRTTLRHRLGTTTPVTNVFCAGAHAAPGAGVPFVGLSAALVAQAVGKA
ncbi:FAD-dependent oxidoreductase [Nocardioides sp. WL0053]|uniref:FAD-dependent oxidoreductase n=1 Tax=Nocardioides jiangsuensis TaxID=2866161 RepID=A0ABS7RFC1_9ACTN|nr:FAD-dependent oxidoreductase [Nocardioides jiangsuensis]MBY9073726.1 FAD-dependent oxidoreductase [Nocardioides jiangsuensis]